MVINTENFSTPQLSADGNFPATKRQRRTEAGHTRTQADGNGIGSRQIDFYFLVDVDRGVWNSILGNGNAAPV